jgi:hypothetical protein
VRSSSWCPPARRGPWSARRTSCGAEALRYIARSGEGPDGISRRGVVPTGVKVGRRPCAPMTDDR